MTCQQLHGTTALKACRTSSGGRVGIRICTLALAGRSTTNPFFLKLGYEVSVLQELGVYIAGCEGVVSTRQHSLRGKTAVLISFGE
jgi:hypothetical protein